MVGTYLEPGCVPHNSASGCRIRRLASRFPIHHDNRARTSRAGDRIDESTLPRKAARPRHQRHQPRQTGQNPRTYETYVLFRPPTGYRSSRTQPGGSAHARTSPYTGPHHEYVEKQGNCACSGSRGRRSSEDRRKWRDCSVRCAVFVFQNAKICCLRMLVTSKSDQAKVRMGSVDRREDAFRVDEIVETHQSTMVE